MAFFTWSEPPEIPAGPWHFEFSAWDMLSLAFDTWRSFPNTAWAKMGLGGVEGGMLYIPSLEVICTEWLTLSAIGAAIGSMPTTMVLHAMAAFDFQHNLMNEIAIAGYAQFIDMRMREEAFYDELPYLIIGGPARIQWWIEYIPVMLKAQMEAEQAAMAAKKAAAEAEFWALMDYFGSLAGVTVDYDYLMALALELPPFAILAALKDVFPQIPIALNRLMWSNSLMELWFDNTMNPLAWIGDHFAARDLIRDPSYVRISENAP